MTRDELSTASEVLNEAADGAGGDAAEALREQADQLATLAEADRGPDHGRLARHQAKLRDIRETVDDEVAARIDEANDLINSYRETLEGV